MKIPIPDLQGCLASAPSWPELLLKMNNNERLLGDVLILLGREAPKLGKAFRQAVERNDYKEARRAAHTLKSNCRQFDLHPFSEFAQSIEQLAMTAEPPELQAYATAFMDVTLAIADWVEKMLELHDRLNPR